MKDEPPRIVVSMNFGEMPRYSLRLRPEVRLCVVAHKRPSMSRTRMPASSAARDALPHQINRVEPIGDLAEIRFRRADNRRAAALQARHRPSSAGTKTG